jgi:hypothetical protein
MYNPKSLLTLHCHVRPVNSTQVKIEINDDVHEFVLEPTLNWVASTEKTDAHEIKFLTPSNEIFTMKISSDNSPILICYYYVDKGLFKITSQPTWNEPEWQPYDVSGHTEDGAYGGTGSLQIMTGQTVMFDALVNVPWLLAAKNELLQN